MNVNVILQHFFLKTWIIRVKFLKLMVQFFFLHIFHLLWCTRWQTSIRSRVILMKIKSPITFERVRELTPIFFRDFRIKARNYCTIFIHFVLFVWIFYLFLFFLLNIPPISYSLTYSSYYFVKSLNCKIPVPIFFSPGPSHFLPLGLNIFFHTGIEHFQSILNYRITDFMELSSWEAGSCSYTPEILGI
jgi:hypothetical protein